MSASKFTLEVRGALIERTASGVSQPDAARAIGVREAAVKSWPTRGRPEESGEYAEFAATISEARDTASSRPEPMDGDELPEFVSACRVPIGSRGGGRPAAPVYCVTPAGPRVR